ncbi:type III pantothenate kinase [Aureivirga sp. CE67]|uniref:type III pantothenate kinase n=1 Tax=Aureivirga sp. CE67 TaxID=1788983 RepID=UPI0018CB6E33|nr:type III pantothenate kinase [Aureivirga sp. CE67]
MNLIIDVGNTRIKVAVFEEDTLVSLLKIDPEMIFQVLEKKIEKYNLQHAILSSVGEKSDEIANFLEGKVATVFLDQQTKVPFINKYETPKTLGVDRIALASAGVSQFPEQNVLVIDAGTCITFDFVNKEKEYLGGAISLGLMMRYKALHNFTAKLPLLTPEIPDSYIGKTSVESMNSGVVNGIIAEIEGIISKYQRDFNNLTIVLTGGDAKFLAKQLKKGIFANPNFLLEGLNDILKYNLK